MREVNLATTSRLHPKTLNAPLQYVAPRTGPAVLDQKQGLKGVLAFIQRVILALLEFILIRYI